jgi:hypothetical protein|tara:strand:+ start:2884 stop:3459 length:576 start_codon:yes stop_codon:yes gene_type:complete
MPYKLNSKEAFKYETYRNIFEANREEQLRLAEKEYKRMQISGSTLDASPHLRDEEGVLLSYENPDNEVDSIKEPYSNVRLLINQKVGTEDRVLKFFGNDIQFNDIFPKEPEPVELTAETDPELQSELDTYRELNAQLRGIIGNDGESTSTTESVANSSEIKKQNAQKNLLSNLKKLGGKMRRQLSKIFGLR